MHNPSHPIDALAVETVEEIQEAVRASARICVRGGGSKPALSTPAAEAVLLDLSGLHGVLTYEPGEFTFTAQAGTSLAEITQILAEQGQYLPFDPPLAGAGATLGGVVAAGTEGAGRYRYGGVRDFLIGIRFVDGRGELVRGGGYVVKNAAGFDFPKLMVGSLGRLGILTELTFKVFPAPAATASLRALFADPEAALDVLVRLSRSQFDLEALDLALDDEGASLWIRIGGLAPALPVRLEQLAFLLHEESQPVRIEQFGHEQEPDYWRTGAEMHWRAHGAILAKVPVTPARIRTLDPHLRAQGAERRYSAGGNTAWIAWPDTPEALHQLLRQHDLAGLLLDGPPGGPWLGRLKGRAFLQRIAATLDPENKYALLDIWPEGSAIE